MPLEDRQVRPLHGIPISIDYNCSLKGYNKQPGGQSIKYIRISNSLIFHTHSGLLLGYPIASGQAWKENSMMVDVIQVVVDGI